MSLYKALVGSLSNIGCCAFTGSSMITFLNSVRDLRPNGFEMLNCAKYVLLGHNAPSQQWELRIATSLIDSMQQDERSIWSTIFGPDLTPELVLATLRSKPELFTVRAALIHQLLKHLDDSTSEVGIHSRLANSLRSIEIKLDAESRHDFLLSLHALRDQHLFLEIMRKLSDGTLANGAEAAKLFPANPAGLKLSKFAALLCGLPDWDGAVRPTLLPPYAHYCRDFISEEGGIFVVNVSRTEAEGIKIKLIDRFPRSLTLFRQCHKIFYQDEAKLISDSIVQVLLRAGIGILSADGKTLKPVRSMFDHPMLQSLYEKSKTDHELEFQQELQQYQQWQKDGCRGRPPNSGLLGFRILRALRNYISHNSEYTELLQRMGWRPVVLDSIVYAFEKCAKDMPWGFFYSADKQHFKLPEDVQIPKSGNNHRSRP